MIMPEIEHGGKARFHSDHPMLAQIIHGEIYASPMIYFVSRPVDIQKTVPLVWTPCSL